MRGGSLAAGEPTGRYTSATHSVLAAIQSLWVLFLEQAAAFPLLSCDCFMPLAILLLHLAMCWVLAVGCGAEHKRAAPSLAHLALSSTSLRLSAAPRSVQPREKQQRKRRVVMKQQLAS